MFFHPNLIMKLKLSLAISLKKVSKFSERLLKHFNSRKIYNTEMVRLFPVEASAMNYEHSLLLEEIIRKLLIILDIELFNINLRK